MQNQTNKANRRMCFTKGQIQTEKQLFLLFYANSKKIKFFSCFQYFFLFSRYIDFLVTYSPFLNLFSIFFIAINQNVVLFYSQFFSCLFVFHCCFRGHCLPFWQWFFSFSILYIYKHLTSIKFNNTNHLKIHVI